MATKLQISLYSYHSIMDFCFERIPQNKTEGCDTKNTKLSVWCDKKQKTTKTKHTRLSVNVRMKVKVNEQLLCAMYCDS